MKDKPKIVLTLIAQQYGMTIEDICEQLGVNKEDIIVEKDTHVAERLKAATEVVRDK